MIFCVLKNLFLKPIQTKGINTNEENIDSLYQKDDTNRIMSFKLNILCLL